MQSLRERELEAEVAQAVSGIEPEDDTDFVGSSSKHRRVEEDEDLELLKRTSRSSRGRATTSFNLSRTTRGATVRLHKIELEEDREDANVDVVEGDDTMESSTASAITRASKRIWKTLANDDNDE